MATKTCMCKTLCFPISSPWLLKRIRISTPTCICQQKTPTHKVNFLSSKQTIVKVIVQSDSNEAAVRCKTLLHDASARRFCTTAVAKNLTYKERETVQAPAPRKYLLGWRRRWRLRPCRPWWPCTGGWRRWWTSLLADQSLYCWKWPRLQEEGERVWMSTADVMKCCNIVE